MSRRDRDYCPNSPAHQQIHDKHLRKQKAAFGFEHGSDFLWQGQKDLNPQPTVLETVALPIELYPYGRLVGIEPTHIGATIRRVNHFTRAAIFKISPESFGSKAEIFTGEYLSSRGVATQVPSACECLTAVFGMGTGGTTQLSSPLREIIP